MDVPRFLGSSPRNVLFGPFRYPDTPKNAQLAAYVDDIRPNACDSAFAAEIPVVSDELSHDEITVCLIDWGMYFTRFHLNGNKRRGVGVKRLLGAMEPRMAEFRDAVVKNLGALAQECARNSVMDWDCFAELLYALEIDFPEEDIEIGEDQYTLNCLLRDPDTDDVGWGMWSNYTEKDERLLNEFKNTIDDLNDVQYLCSVWGGLRDDLVDRGASPEALKQCELLILNSERIGVGGLPTL